MKELDVISPVAEEQKIKKERMKTGKKEIQDLKNLK